MDCSNNLSTRHYRGFKAETEMLVDEERTGIKRAFSQIEEVFAQEPITVFKHCDVKVVILNEIDVPSLMAFSLTSKFYRSIAKTMLIQWLNFEDVAFDGLVEKDMLASIINFFGEDCSEITSFIAKPKDWSIGDSEMKLISEKFTLLKTLDIKSQLSNASMDYLNKMTSLSMLKLTRDGKNKIDFGSIGEFSNLDALNLEGYKIKNLEFLSKCPNLQHLLLQVNASLKEASFGKFCTSLRTLNLTNYHGDDLDLEGCSLINEINIDCYNIKNINFIKSTQLLKKLSLTLNGDPLDLNALEGFTTLQKLSISNAVTIDINVLKGCTGLEYLALCEIEEIIGIDVLEMCGSSLKILKLVDAQFTPPSFQLCTALKDVDLWGCEIEELRSLKKCTHIEKLVLPATLDNLNFIKNFSALKYLDLSSCSLSIMPLLPSFDHYHP